LTVGLRAHGAYRDESKGAGNAVRGISAVMAGPDRNHARRPGAPAMIASADQRARFLASGDDALLPIIDPHHHFFDLGRNDHPWLKDHVIPFRYGDYSAIRRDFMPGDYARAAAEHLIVGTVLMEGEWNPRDPVGEMRWVADRPDLARPRGCRRGRGRLCGDADRPLRAPQAGSRRPRGA
jgi:hypothetical protein